jgi:hypothetical protein
MTEQAEQFRRKAIECEQRAEAAPDDRIATQLLEIAKQWRQLADRIERHSPFGRYQNPGMK